MNEYHRKNIPTSRAMSLIFLAPLIVFIFWYALHRFSDDVSAIESFRSVESVGDDIDKQEEATVRKSKSTKALENFDERPCFT